MKKLFGTDGIRAKANVFPMTPDIVLLLGKALGALIQKGDIGRKEDHFRKKVVIGKDTRLSCYLFEQALSAGLCAMGVDTYFVGPMPTPAVAFLTRSMRADAGLMVTASHNPFYDNGIKIFDHEGFKLKDSFERELENLVLEKSDDIAFHIDETVGKSTRIDDALGRYIVHLKSLVPESITLDGMKVVMDCAHGAGYKVAPMALQELGAQVISTGVEPNGTNINARAGALAPARAQMLVKSAGADLGLALDGDADRLLAIDELGEVVHGDALIAMLAIALKTKGELKEDTVVATVMSNMGLEECLKKEHIKVIRTDVGDRFVVKALREKGLSFGGENSGHIVNLRHATSGDGMLAALLLLKLMRETKKSLSQLKAVFKPYPQALINRDIPQKVPLETLKSSQQAIVELEQELKDNGRVLVRYSGTELKLRVMVEAKPGMDVEPMAQKLADVICAEIAAA